MVEYKKKPNIKANYIYNLLYEVLLLLVPLVTTPYVSRVLGADGIGIYSYTLSNVTYFALVGKLGLASYGQLQVVSHRDDKVAMSYLFWEITCIRFITIGISSIAFLLVIVLSKEYSTYYTLLLINLLSCTLDFAWFLQGLEEFKKIVVRNTIVKLLSVVLVFLCIKEKADLNKYFIILQGTILVGNMLMLPQINKHIIKVKLKDLNIFRHLKSSIVYFIPTIATTIYLSLDKSMLGWIIGSNFENGYYEQAHKIEQVAVTVVTSLSVVAMPRMAYLFKNGKELAMRESIDTSIRFVMCLSIPMAFGLSGISKVLVPWFLGKEYERSIELLCIFSWLIVIIGLNNVVGKQVLMACGRQKEYNYAVIAGAAVNIIINAILIPVWASKGAAIASVCAETVILLIFIRFGKDFVTIKKIISNSIKYLASGLVMFSILYFINKEEYFTASAKGVVGEIVLGFLIYSLSLIIMHDEFVFKQIKDGMKFIKRNTK